ncbi:MAG: VanZ family protein [Calditrichaeota bacterium]|nr:VanZ family protein [Calditrichota bacterium]
MTIQRKIVFYSFLFFTFLIIYNTLIPFRFDYGFQDLPNLIRQIEWFPYHSTRVDISLTDIVGNILLFVPFGFLLYTLLNQMGMAYPFGLTLLCGAALSFSIEFVQLFIKARNTAPHDLINNTLGTALGALVAMIYSIRLSAFLRTQFYSLLQRKPFLLLLIILGGAQGMAALMPFTVSITVSDLKKSLKSTNLVPFDYVSIGKLFFRSPTPHDSLPFDVFAFVENLLFWMVIGYLLFICYRIYWRKKTFGRWLLIGLPLVYFPLLEFAQLFITSRITDINDILSGYLGIALGFALYQLLRPIRRKHFHHHIDLLRIPLVLYGIFILFAGLQPFDWTTSAEVIHRDLRAENLIPFFAYFRKTSLWNLYDLLNSLTYFLPISLYWSYRLREKGIGYFSIYLRTVPVGLAVGGFIELSQIFSHARIAEITDVLAYGMGGAAGTFLIYYYETQVKPTLDAVRNGLLELSH